MDVNNTIFQRYEKLMNIKDWSTIPVVKEQLSAYMVVLKCMEQLRKEG